MTNTDSNSTDTTSIGANAESDVEYFDFLSNRLIEAAEALAILAGAKSLLQNSDGFEENEDLVSVNSLFFMLREKIDSIAFALDASTPVYSLKTTV